MQDSILVAGYPLGGDSLSITKGIVSRVVMTRYAHASNKLLGIQIDAAINPGNSGGPAFSDLQEVRFLHLIRRSSIDLQMKIGADDRTQLEHSPGVEMGQQWG